jgi:hypothetical protein
MRSGRHSLGAWASSALLVASCLTTLSCRGRRPPPRHETALDLCLDDAYRGTDRHATEPPPEVVTAARACIAKYVRAPQFDRWATRLPKPVAGAKLREGDDIFLQKLVKCAAEHQISIDLVRNEDGSRRIEANSQTSPNGVRSTDPAFLECARAGENAERTFLAQAGQNHQ